MIKTGAKPDKFSIIDTNSSCTIGHIKFALRHALHVPTPLQRIYDVHANQLPTCRTLSQCGVQNREMLFMVVQGSEECVFDCVRCSVAWARLVGQPGM